MTRTPFSGSNIYRRALCPGSLALESALAEPPPSPEAAEGTLLHSHMADPSLPRDKLTAEQVGTLELAEEMREKFFADLVAKHSLTSQPLDGKEEEFWFHDGMTALWSNHADIYRYWKTEGVLALPDYKFGFEPAPAADENWQILSYLCSAAEDLDASDYYGCIIKPRVSSALNPVHYTKDQIELGRKELLRVWNACRGPSPPRNPSPDGCKYCRGLQTGRCIEAGLVPVVVAKAWNLAVIPIERLQAMTPLQRGQAADMISIAKQIVANYEEALKELLKADENAISGWMLSKPKILRPITDPTTVWERCEKQGLKLDAFMACVKVTKGELERRMSLATDLKGKALDQRMEDVLAGCTDSIPTEPSLKRV